MDLRVVVSACGLCVLFDLLLSSLLLTQGFSRGLVPPGLAEMSGLVLALWGCSWLRSSLLIGACLGVMCNRQDGPRRISRSAPAALLVAMVMVTFAVAALLALTEVDSLKNQAWEMGLISWTCISSVGLVLMWRLLGDARDTVRNMNIYKTGAKVLGQNQDQNQDQSQSSPGAKEEPEETNSGATLGRLLCYCRKDSGLLTVATLFLLISAVCEAFIPFFYGVAIDSIVKHQSMELFSRPVLILAALAVASSLAMGVRGGVFTLVFARLNLRLRNHLFRTLMKQEIGFFDKNHTGDLLSRLSADVTQVSDLVSQNLNIFLRSAVKASGFSVFMFRLSWRLSLVSLMGFPFIGLVSQLYGDYYKTLTKEVQSTLAEANRVAEETVSAMRTVRSFANEQGEAESYYSKLLQVFKLNRRQALAYALYMWSSCLSEVALELAVLYYGGHLVVSGQLSSGALISFFIYMLQLGECLESMASVYTGLMQGVGAAEKVFEYLDREPEHSAEQGTEEPDTCSGLVEFRDVTFSYPTRPHTHVLKGVSFTLHPGKVTALVGPSGGGKSSCVSLMENFYLPQSGQVLLDGRPVQSLRHLYLHSKVALVGQEPVLFARSVEENISYGLSHVTKENIERAAREANAHDFICSLHQGYATSVGEKGAQLSGGQKQRVAIARALVRNPRVLILDEATSALDAHSEHMVQQALMSVMKERTVLVVAHRLSSVENADHIVVIVDGRVAEQGTHAELMDRRQVYHRLVQRQVLGLE
ncbi:hypothetical protein NQD34_006638, partial [Periophthalmus magnuspinnatus]